MNWTMRKYPRTQHLEGSRLGFGDDTDMLPVSALAGETLVVEEKVDGANTAISFDGSGVMHLQSRGHELGGGPREAQFALFKTWASTHSSILGDILADRYIAYGEWCYAKHTMFYDALPHYWLEFDILDTKTGLFLDTATRHAMWAGSSVVSVPVVEVGQYANIGQLTKLVKPSLYKTAHWVDSLTEAALASGCDPEDAIGHTDMSGLAEGLYIKVERDGVVQGRYKWVRAGFNQAIEDSGSHWMDRTIIANRLADDEVLWR